MSWKVLPKICLPAALAAAALCIGCADKSAADRPKLVPAGGTVRYNDAPVEGATVIFVPEGHKHAAVGRTDASGRFQLQTYDPNDGAAPGEYKVTVRKTEVISESTGSGSDDDELGESEERSLLPERYSSTQSSGLTASVQDGGDNQFNFDLTDD